MALSADSGSDAAAGRLSHPWQLTDAGTLQPWATPVGQTLHVMVTSYNDTGQTAAGYTTSLGVCAVDPRVIPWGTRFYVPDYGYCYAADIGLWIRDDTVDVWLPGQQAAGWGVQHRDLRFVADT
jgi:3D (Asp-Asp-Asp) domain-containing protein